MTLSIHAQKSFQRISDLMSGWVHKIKSDNAMGMLDINRITEDILVPIFSVIYGYSGLKNLNDDGENFPGIDLGDKINRVAFQITSDASGEKVKKTIDIFTEKNIIPIIIILLYILLPKNKEVI